MAGNVKEWSWNESANGRMILGGAWNEPGYMFDYRRLAAAIPAPAAVRLQAREEHRPAAGRFVLTVGPHRSGLLEGNAGRPTLPFAVFRRLYAYDPLPLDEKVENVEETPDWRKETVTIAAPDGGERIIVHLYLPRLGAAVSGRDLCAGRRRAG